MKLALIAGARPNFMKIAPLLWALSARPNHVARVIHTGQHYDHRMSRVFFEQLALPPPDVDLGVGSGSHALQAARVMERLEPVLQKESPDWVIVVGDVNSTLAAALTAVKLGIPTAHVEAGLRSGDRRMPEEINRLATDAVCDLLLAPSDDAVENLRREGHTEERILMCGNVMVDTLLRFLPRTDLEGVLRNLKIDGDYLLATLHRPALVDDPEQLEAVLTALEEVARSTTVVFPVHPRTRPLIERLRPSGPSSPALRLLEPLPYLEFLALEKGAAVVVTDSGGIQEETTVLGVPCLTLRDTTERPITVHQGSNRVLGCDPRVVPGAVATALAAPPAEGKRPRGWDGRAAERIIARLEQPAPPRGPSAPAGAGPGMP